MAAENPLNWGNVTEWSYWDSNLRPLACHPAATRPQKSVSAGHRPETCTQIPLHPGLLRYFLLYDPEPLVP
jgi:hypothetical protein